MDFDDISALELDESLDLLPSVTFGQPSAALAAPGHKGLAPGSRPTVSPVSVRCRPADHQRPAPTQSTPPYRCTVTSEDIDCLSLSEYSQNVSQLANKRPRLSQHAQVHKAMQHTQAGSSQRAAAVQQVSRQPVGSSTAPAPSSQRPQSQLEASTSGSRGQEPDLTRVVCAAAAAEQHQPCRLP